MYNRYIPQPDGSYRRNRVSDPQSYSASTGSSVMQVSQQKKNENVPQQSHPTPVPNIPETQKKPSNCHQAHTRSPDRSASNFLKQLLPKDIDTSDLLIILLLLLMAGDNDDERNNALLTLALYFFL